MADGDLQQVHLVVHFPVAAFIAIRRNLRAEPCLAGAGCVFRCFFSGDDALVPHPCRVVPRGAGGYPVGDMTLRALPTTAAPERLSASRRDRAIGSAP